jgi:hypothetical protein
MGVFFTGFFNAENHPYCIDHDVGVWCRCSFVRAKHENISTMNHILRSTHLLIATITLASITWNTAAQSFAERQECHIAVAAVMELSHPQHDDQPEYMVHLHISPLSTDAHILITHDYGHNHPWNRTWIEDLDADTEETTIHTELVAYVPATIVFEYVVDDELRCSTSIERNAQAGLAQIGRRE